MNGFSSAYDLGDIPAPRGQSRAVQHSDLGSTTHLSTCGACHEMVAVDTDGMGGLIDLDPTTYLRHHC